MVLIALAANKKFNFINEQLDKHIGEKEAIVKTPVTPLRGVHDAPQEKQEIAQQDAAPHEAGRPPLGIQ